MIQSESEKGSVGIDNCLLNACWMYSYCVTDLLLVFFTVAPCTLII